MEWNDAKLTNELLNKRVFESENSSKLFAGKRRKGPLSIHDAHCATLWSEPEFASQFCDELLPEVANNYDTKRVEICPSVFVDDSLTKIYADAVWRIPSNVPGKAPL
ncbi:MAG: Rpn family recombination-promoting nuclease/putative transposase [Thermoguttaceae bacterium]|nr:Rpn family recombination-promoting nuclease/putative transposase [Thermoguttaceae bacterium]